MRDDDDTILTGDDPSFPTEQRPDVPAEAVLPPGHEPSRFEPARPHIGTPHTYAAPDPYAPSQTYAAPAQEPVAAHLDAAPPTDERKRWSGGAVIAAAVAGSIIGGVLMAAAMLLLLAPRMVAGEAATPVETVSGKTQQAVSIDASGASEPIQAVAAKVTPSVVNIGVERQVVDPFTGRTQSQVTGNGSGVIIRADGYILTNNHVISDASKIIVTLGLDDVTAKVVGVDPASDLAVLKVDRTGLPAAELGDSEDIQVGETVVAVGSPFGLDKTVTAGIVSALHRTGQASDRQQSTIYPNLIQTDAPINPGNSGGALADLSGQVIGINTLIQTGGAQQSAGIGFAIPIKVAKQVADQLISTGKATHTFFGVVTVDVTARDAEMYGLKTTTGALVQQVEQGSPAGKAGVLRGDVILRVGDTPVKDGQSLIAAVRQHAPGDQVKVLIEREGKQQTVDVTLASRSSSQ